MAKEDKQKGVILYITLLIVSIFMAIVITLTSISMSQIKISFQAGDSVKAFTAADTGVERVLYNIRNADPVDFSDIGITSLSNGSSYTADITINSSTTATIQSKGVFGKTRRTIEATY
ncbi:MAG: pilus assembly PilX N-terminal domain-containing protein [bacterium]|nr:pilus assembly PilX N-terminal domain-containing protein [bacterium]